MSLIDDPFVVEEIVGKLCLSEQYCNCIQARLEIAKQRRDYCRSRSFNEGIHSYALFCSTPARLCLLPAGSE